MGGIEVTRGAPDWDVRADVVVVGGGGCGLTAGLAAALAGGRDTEVLVLEKMPKPLSNTARSGGMIPAAGTHLQRAAGIEEAPEDFAADILAKNGHTSDEHRTLHLARTGRDLVEWLHDEVGAKLEVVTDFKYPGHRTCRMHAPPSRTGAELVADLREALGRLPQASVVTGTEGAGLFADERGAVVGVRVKQGPEEVRVGARRVILACNGYGGNRAMLRAHCPGIEHALYFGGEGSTGEGIEWGLALGGETEHMDAYQAHASVAHPHGILITYAVVMEGGVQVNAEGRRFADETRGYSEHALSVLAQPGRVAYEIFDGRIHRLAEQFADYRDAVEAGAIRSAYDLRSLAAELHVDAEGLEQTMADVSRWAAGDGTDPLGRRDFRRLEPPYYGVRVTGALFHTQGGLRVDEHARVLHRDGHAIPGLYAGGGAAAGISGSGAGGYLSGNGLLTALGYGMLAGRHAAKSLKEGRG